MKKLAGNCLFFKGYRKNLLIDLQNNDWYHTNLSEEELCSHHLVNDNAKYFLENGIIIDIPEQFLKNFERITTNYYSFPQIESVIMDFDINTNYDPIAVLNYLDRFNPVWLQLRFYCPADYNEINNLLIELSNLTIEYVELILPYDEDFMNKFKASNLTNEFSKFKRIIFHSCHPNKSNLGLDNTYFTQEKILSHLSCGQVGYFNFSNNSNQVLKSLNFNSCLYKKVGIDINGNIKNCPSMETINGSVFNLEDTKFKFETEQIKKDDIEVCKDCEFRHICTDCRAFTDSRSRPNSRPSKCDYNPYIGKWRHEKGFLSLYDVGVISNETEFSINHERIAMINESINDN